MTHTHFIKIQDTTFNVSNSVFDTITKNNLIFKVVNDNGKEIHLLDDSCLTSFLVIATEHSTHFFIKIGESNKLRVNKLFYDFLVLHSKQHNVEKMQTSGSEIQNLIDVHSLTAKPKQQKKVKPIKQKKTAEEKTKKLSEIQDMLDIHHLTIEIEKAKEKAAKTEKRLAEVRAQIAKIRSNSDE